MLAFGAMVIVLAAAPYWGGRDDLRLLAEIYSYVALASLAGWFYGAAFRSGGNLIASSLTHALVDTAWRTWFSRV